MSKQGISRRQFIQTSLSVAAGIAAMSVNPLANGLVNAQENQPPELNPEAIPATVEQIAPGGIIQTRLIGESADKLADIVLRYANAQYTILAGGSVLSTNGNYLSAEVQQTAHKEITDRITGIAEDGLRYTDYSLEIQIEGVWAEINTATVIWTEKVGLSFGGESDPNVPPAFYETRTHLTSLQRDGTTWRIIADDPEFGYQRIPISPDGVAFSENPFPDIVKECDSINGAGQHQVYIPLVIQGGQETNTISSEVMLLAGTYSREKAASYAVNKAYTPDGFGSGKTGYYDWGANCTNFVSQCMRAGGWKDVTGWYSSNNAWWYTGLWPKYGSYTWAGAENFYWFLNNSGRATRIYNPYNLWFGDVIQYDFNKDNSIDHVQICHYRSTSGVCYMAQHTTNYAWKPLRDVLAGKNWWSYSWRLKTSY